MSSKTVGVLDSLVYLVISILNFLRRWRNLNQLVWGASFRMPVCFGCFIKRWFLLPNKKR